MMIALDLLKALVTQSTPVDFGMVLPALIAVAGLLLMLSFGMLVIWMSMQQAHAARVMAHAERMKAIESGIPWEESDASKVLTMFIHHAFWISLWMVIFGCGGSFLAASTLMDYAPFENQMVPVIGWASAGAASIASVVCATVLMSKARGNVPPRRTPPHTIDLHSQ